MQFLSFKLSFNDYYIQDISNKIKSVKKKKMNKGEYQAGIAPYGYKKDTEIKNHLVIDENVSYIVQEIFEMYANKEMSTTKIADELNKRNITPPGIYMKMPSTRKNLNSKNPDGRYVWLRTQIGSMLKNQTYIGNVISGKKEQISPKVKKTKMKEKSEYIIKENMHEPIISKELWNKVQDKLNSYHTDNRKKYEYCLEDLVYCGECGNKARFQHNKSKTKSDKVYWEGNYAVCGKRADYISLCNNVVIGEKILINAVREAITEEIKKIEYTSKELNDIYNKAKLKAKSSVNLIQSELVYKSKELNNIENQIKCLYEKKLTKQITIDKFKELYKTISEKKEKIKQEIDKINKEIKKNNKEIKDESSDDKKIKKIANELFKIEDPNNELLKKLVKKVTFHKNKKITVELTFSQVQ